MSNSYLFELKDIQSKEGLWFQQSTIFTLVIMNFVVKRTEKCIETWMKGIGLLRKAP